MLRGRKRVLPLHPQSAGKGNENGKRGKKAARHRSTLGWVSSLRQGSRGRAIVRDRETIIGHIGIKDPNTMESLILAQDER